MDIAGDDDPAGDGELICDDYEERVSADLDGELGDEAAAIRAHVAACERCRRLRERQAEIRTLVRSRLAEPAPDRLREGISAALDRASGTPARGRLARRLGLVGFGLAAAAAVVFVVLTPRSVDFTALAETYRVALESGPKIDLATGNAAELERFYASRRELGIPSHVVDLGRAGFRLVGGSIQRFPGRSARITVYRDGDTLVLCDYQWLDAFPKALPESGEPVFFEQGGLSFCASRHDREVCLLVTRMPLALFRSRILGHA